MDAIANQYASSPDNSDTEPSPSTARPKKRINAAPDVAIQDIHGTELFPADLKQAAFNISYQDMTKPVAGPMLPFTKPLDDVKNHARGIVEPLSMREYDFESQRRTYNSYGYAADPAQSANLIGNTAAALTLGNATVNDRLPESAREAFKRKRVDAGDAAKANGYLGPWAGYEGEAARLNVDAPTEEEVALMKAVSEGTYAPVAINPASAKTFKETSVFHGGDERDYLGRSYIHVPRDVDLDLTREVGSRKCFLPKRLIHTWTGHGKGVNAIRFFPNSGHLLLSASMDAQIKLWDTYHDRRCLRTFNGHEKAVRDICFSGDGRRFLSASYDKYVKLWDTETGQCIARFTDDRIPYVVKFNPSDENVFLAGSADKKIVQWDINSNQIVTEYNEHLGAINTITFIDQNRRFISTSDDKTIRVWEYGIPVTIKTMQEVWMHSIPSVAVHPKEPWGAFQSMDNQILVYSTDEKVRMHRKKRFVGHGSAGQSCQVNFSPDGKYLISGDSGGRLMIWDWESKKLLKQFKAHDKVCVGAAWHPQEPSKIATCSWDGTIKYWD